MEARLSTLHRTTPATLAVWLIVVALAALAVGWTGYRLGSQATAPASQASVAPDPGGTVYPAAHDSRLPASVVTVPDGVVYAVNHDSRLPGSVVALPNGVVYPATHDSRLPGSVPAMSNGVAYPDDRDSRPPRPAA